MSDHITPLHVVQSVNDPTYRKLIVEDGDLTVGLELPPNGGPELTAKMRAHPTFEEDYAAASNLGRYFTIVTQTNVDAIKKAKALRDNDSYEFKFHQIPFRVRAVLAKK